MEKPAGGYCRADGSSEQSESRGGVREAATEWV